MGLGQKSLREELGHLAAGLSKLEEASATVDDLSTNAVKKQKELQAAQVIFLLIMSHSLPVCQNLGRRFAFFWVLIFMRSEKYRSVRTG